MDKKRFTESKIGRLVKIGDPNCSHAFVPDDIPAGWSLPVDLWPEVAKAKQKLGTLSGIGMHMPNPGLLIRPLQNREALRSSSLEGTYATPEQLLLFEMSPKESKSEKDEVNAALEVNNYSKALREGYERLLDNTVSLPFIRQLHKRLLEGVRGRDKSPGQFRDSQVFIGSDYRFAPPPPFLLQDCLESFETLLRNRLEPVDSLIACYMLHYQFEAIHPFKDGNGRVGRLLLALTTWKWCGLSMPGLYMSAFFEKYKDEYIDSLFLVSARGDWERYLRFCLRGTIVQVDDAIFRCEKLMRVRETMHEKAKTGSSRLHPIIEDLFSHPFTTVPHIRDQFGVTDPTAKADIVYLQEQGILSQLAGKRRPIVYFCPDILNIAFSEDTP